MVHQQKCPTTVVVVGWAVVVQKKINNTLSYLVGRQKIPLTLKEI